MAMLPKSKFSESEIGLLSQYGKLIEEIGTSGTAFQNAVADFQGAKIKEMQKNLIDSKRVSSRKLSQSLVPENIFVNEDGDIVVAWGGEKYAPYIDQGVNGIEKKFGSAFTFRERAKVKSPDESNNFYTSIRDWMKFRGINSVKFKDQNGKLQTKWLKTEKDYKQGAFVLIQSIKRNGIRPSFFIENAFKDESQVIKEFETTLRNEWEKIE